MIFLFPYSIKQNLMHIYTNLYTNLYTIYIYIYIYIYYFLLLIYIFFYVFKYIYNEDNLSFLKDVVLSQTQRWQSFWSQQLVVLLRHGSLRADLIIRERDWLNQNIVLLCRHGDSISGAQGSHVHDWSMERQKEKKHKCEALKLYTQ